MSSPLLRCILLPGQSVRIGRKVSLELSVNRPYLSNLHCQLDLRVSPNGGYGCGVIDHSHNGTWWLPLGVDLKNAVRLKNRERQELVCGDIVLLLSPSHKHCCELRFQLGSEAGEYVLSQLPPTDDPPRTQGTKREGGDDCTNSPTKIPRLTNDNTCVRSCVETCAVDEGISTDTHTRTPVPDIDTIELEYCPHCTELISVPDLPSHVDLCRIPHPSLVKCPLCFKSYPTADLLSHVDTCCGGSNAGSAREYTLEPYAELTSYNAIDVEVDGTAKKEQCVAEGHNSASESDREHCEHCLKLFSLTQLIDHALSCSQQRGLDSAKCVDGSQDEWGEPVERCMHCFRDFPLSSLVGHSRLCEGDMLGPRGRFTAFLPSVHDMDPMALSVLTETQMAAVDYVMKRSKVEAESAYPELKRKVVSLGYTEKDLDTTLQWVRRDAPIIVHVNLDRVLEFLVKDSHYRNLFEVRSGGGSTDTTARASWEDRIFNNLYVSSPPSERVKYGVLNIVGDPRGVQSCYSYGDSFLQLKKVRLRTTFASTDTSHSGVQLSCCEHYGNVLNQYSNPELQAILDVATRKQPFLQSNVITQYKEVQIHGPLCLSENVDCIVVNDRHASDSATRGLLDTFLEQNKCNLLWMDSVDSIGYPSFTPSSHIPLSMPPVPIVPPIAWAPPTARRRRRRRRRHHRDSGW